MSDGDEMIGQEREVKSRITPGALTRHIFYVDYGEGDRTDEFYQADEANDALAALRATITQQAQELAESERKLREVCMAHGPALLEIHDLKKELEKLKGVLGANEVLVERLAAMTRERDEWQVQYTEAKKIQWGVETGEFWFWNDDEQDHIDSLICPVVVRPEKLKEWKQQLAAAQARCRGMEEKLEVWVRRKDRWERDARGYGTPEQECAEQATHAQLQATLAGRELRIRELDSIVLMRDTTLAAREARIEELLDGRYKAALYDLIIDLSRIELSEMSTLGRAAWDRLVKGGWYADDLEKLLMQASAAQQARGSSGGDTNHDGGQR